MKLTMARTLLAVDLLFSIAFFGLVQAPDGGETCTTSSTVLLFLDELSAVASETCPGGSSSGGGGGSSTPESRWDTYCSGSFLEGSTVEIAQGAEVTSGSNATYSASSSPGQVAVPTSLEQVIIPAGVRYFNYAITCASPTGTTIQTVLLPEGAAPVSPIALRNEVRARIRIPDPALAGSPPLDDPDRFSVVQIPTWFWIDHPWEPITDSETRGGVSVSVTATPTKVVWDPGDGAMAVECLDAGTPWQGIRGATTDCSHTYTRSSAEQPDAAYQLSATVHWDFTWTLNGTPQSSFGTYEPVTEISHQVGEIQVISTPTQTN